MKIKQKTNSIVDQTSILFSGIFLGKVTNFQGKVICCFTVMLQKPQGGNTQS